MIADCEEVFDPMKITTKRMRHANAKKEKGLGARSGNVYVVNCLDFFCFCFVDVCCVDLLESTRGIQWQGKYCVTDANTYTIRMQLLMDSRFDSEKAFATTATSTTAL